jgi:leader peptidase (prepilin peptidase)/N-methyltransferase
VTGLAGALVGAVAGALGGGLVALPAYRLSVPRESLPRARCEACGAALAWWGRRCRGCGRRPGTPWWLLAWVGGAVGAGLGWRVGPVATLLPYLLLGVLGVLLAAVDLACRRLPNALVLPAVPAGVVLLGALSAGDWSALGRAALAAVALGGAYLVLAVLPGGGLGFGDVKLAVLLGLFLGWLGWAEVLAGLLLPFLLHGPVALLLLASGRVGRRTMLPFGPAMLAGAWLAIVGRHGLLTALES